MEKTTAKALVYGLAGLASVLLSILGYLYGHKLITAADLTGIGAALWQMLCAFLLVSLAGGLGRRLLQPLDIGGLTEFGLGAALGALILAVGILILGAVIGTTWPVFVVPALIMLAVLNKDVIEWLKTAGDLRTSLSTKYEQIIALGAISILAISMAYALAPPTGFDALVYHLAIPRAYLEQGRVTFLADTMFWGMPQLTEMLFLPLVGLAGVQACTALVLMIGVVTLMGLLGYLSTRFNSAAAWTAVAALLMGENLTRSLSSGYVDWMSMLFGGATLVALDYWLESQDRRMLLLSGTFCGAALGTKYSAGVLLIGSMMTLATMQLERPKKQATSNLLTLVLAAILASSPWWIKNVLATGNPFYPFFIPAGSMDRIRLDFYQNVPVWRDWRAIVLLPWQATFLGIDGKEGFSASIGPLLVGLSPLAWINWKSRTEPQKRIIRIAGVILISGLILWGIASRLSGLLIQTRLYFVLFPAWAVLAGAGMDSVSGIRMPGIRIGRVLGALVILMFTLSVYSLWKGSLAASPASYILRLEDEEGYLSRNLGSYAAAMQAVNDLPATSRVLMLWETRGYYCQPICDSDEIIDRWFHDANLYRTSDAIIQAWHTQGYTKLLIYNAGMQFVREYDIPNEQRMHWSVLDATLADLPVASQIDNGVYTLYTIP